MYRPNDYRTPRTLNEAFGPYSDFQVNHERRQFGVGFWLIGAIVVTVLASCVLSLFH